MKLELRVNMIHSKRYIEFSETIVWNIVFSMGDFGLLTKRRQVSMS